MKTITLAVAGFAICLAACGSETGAVQVTPELPAAVGIFGALAARLRARAADVRKLSGPVRIELVDRPSEFRIIDPRTGALEEAEQPTAATLRVTPDALAKLGRGELQPMDAMVTGELLMDGDFVLLITAVALFAEPAGVDAPPVHPSRDAVAAARMAVFEAWGATFPDGPEKRLIPAVSASMSGGPAWPTRESYAVMRIGPNTVVATDGLSDPSADGPEHGFGMEVWAETDQPLENPARSWLTALIVAVGQQVAFGAITPEHLGRFGMGSFEIPISQMKFDGTWPSSVVSPDGTVGMIIGATSPTRPDRLVAPFDDVRYFNIRVISAAELRELVAGGLPVGKRLAESGTVSRLPAH